MLRQIKQLTLNNLIIIAGQSIIRMESAGFHLKLTVNIEI